LKKRLREERIEREREEARRAEELIRRHNRK
jgi:hypothetical protein